MRRGASGPVAGAFPPPPQTHPTRAPLLAIAARGADVGGAATVGDGVAGDVGDALQVAESGPGGPRLLCCGGPACCAAASRTAHNSLSPPYLPTRRLRAPRSKACIRHTRSLLGRPLSMQLRTHKLLTVRTPMTISRHMFAVVSHRCLHHRSGPVCRTGAARPPLARSSRGSRAPLLHRSKRASPRRSVDCCAARVEQRHAARDRTLRRHTTTREEVSPCRLQMPRRSIASRSGESISDGLG